MHTESQIAGQRDQDLVMELQVQPIIIKEVPESIGVLQEVILIHPLKQLRMSVLQEGMTGQWATWLQVGDQGHFQTTEYC